jgi:acyl-CoA reductase-like NAD-dependent aldehyde dehydrogenase
VTRGTGKSVRLPVKKTYKLYVGGAFPRSESGRSYEAEGANVARASRKDLRDAVRAAREAFPKWASMTAYNRGQVLYRVAEIMEGRRAQFVELTGDEAEVDAAIDSWVWYAGWADKLAQVLGSSNPVAGPYFNFTLPEPTGVVGVVAPEEPVLCGLRRAPRAGHRRRQRGRDRRLAEAPARCGDPCRGARHLGRPGRGRQRPHRQEGRALGVLAAHMDVNAVDLSGAGDEREELERLAADNVKRVVSNGDGQSPWHVAAFLELKTVWHPIGV